ncbi:MAG TPA: hypothetical protein PKN39_04190 [Oscillospiraceae bacterium]|nr:hypothetical protein [Oscillospiraceae bacterium]
MNPIVYVFIAIALAGAAGVVVTLKKKKTTPREVFAPKMTVYVTLTVVFALMAVMTGLFTK